MTTALVLLVLLGFGVAGPATALQFDTFSLSAVIAPVFLGPFIAGTGTLVTATAYPDFQFQVAFSSAHPAAVSVLGCSNPVPIVPFLGLCRPGDQVYAGAASGPFLHTSGSISYPGTFFTSCDVQGFPQRSFGPPTIGDRCANFSVDFLIFAAVVLPPFTGTTEISVESTFSTRAGAAIREVDTPFSAQFVDGVGFSGTGHGEFDLVWQADQQAWLPLRAEGYIAATPEPATLLLWGTSAAGLGLVRWYRRRGRAHAA
jgi:hypothetical protein